MLLSLSPPQSDREPFRVEVQADREVVRVSPVGELDLATVDQVEGHIRELRATGFRHIVVDLRRLTFLDSTGLRLLLSLDAAARGDGLDLTLIPGGPAVQRVFELCGVPDRLPFRSA